MATISGIRAWGLAPAQATEDGQREEMAAKQSPNRLRAMPNEDLYLFRKRIDNRVVRQADPAARGRCWSAIGAACVLTVVLASMLAPSIGMILAGYQIQSLKGEQQKLADERRRLVVEEAALLSPARLAGLAQEREMRQPGAGQVVHIEGEHSASVALNTVR
jgi:cell division protein FtsL